MFLDKFMPIFGSPFWAIALGSIKSGKYQSLDRYLLDKVSMIRYFDSEKETDKVVIDFENLEVSELNDLVFLKGIDISVWIGYEYDNGLVFYGTITDVTFDYLASGVNATVTALNILSYKLEADTPGKAVDIILKEKDISYKDFLEELISKYDYKAIIIGKNRYGRRLGKLFEEKRSLATGFDAIPVVPHWSDLDYIKYVAEKCDAIFWFKGELFYFGPRPRDFPPQLIFKYRNISDEFLSSLKHSLRVDDLIFNWPFEKISVEAPTPKRMNVVGAAGILGRKIERLKDELKQVQLELDTLNSELIVIDPKTGKKRPMTKVEKEAIIKWKALQRKKKKLERKINTLQNIVAQQKKPALVMDINQVNNADELSTKLDNAKGSKKSYTTVKITALGKWNFVSTLPFIVEGVLTPEHTGTYYTVEVVHAISRNGYLMSIEGIKVGDVLKSKKKVLEEVNGMTKKMRKKIKKVYVDYFKIKGALPEVRKLSLIEKEAAALSEKQKENSEE